MRSQDPVVGYLPKGFPRISETFVTAEILELERLGLDLRIYPLKKPETAERQSNVRRVIAPVRYVPERVLAWLPLLVPVHLVLAVRRPRAYWGALRYTLSRCRRSRSTSTLRRFAQAGWLAGWMLRDKPVRHMHAHFCHGSATVAMFLKWLTGIPYSFTAHAKDLYMTEPDILRDKMRHAEFVVTCTAANLFTNLAFVFPAPPGPFPLPVPNDPSLLLQTLVFQGMALQPQACMRMTDALHVTIRSP